MKTQTFNDLIEQINQAAGRRWQIECYFKVAKQYLQFDQTQVQSYDGLALAQRENTDDRTLGDLFFDYGRPLPDIKLVSTLNWLIQTITGLGEKLDMAVETFTIIFDEFIKALPSSLARLLGNAQ